ncbi:MAG: D-alanyl-D-alanine carboxypeptidase [Oscillospiraceae bacterium]|nr:D-alanyl-D-alanine carboxypeptidase [Oscillospiraceae bacterium]
MNMMIKRGLALLSAVLFMFPMDMGIKSIASDKEYTESYVLMEPETGTVVRERNGRERVRMGSFNKLMTVLLAAEAMDRGELTPDTVLTASENANSKQGAQIWLMPGEKMTLDELLKGVIIGNANDAACVIAEKIGGTEEKFTELMNKKAAELGMNDTLFTECTGYYGDSEQYTTAYDAALLLCELYSHSQLTGYFTTRLDEIKGGEVQLVSANPMGSGYKGSVGFKCGTGPESGYFAAEGAEREGIAFVCAVMDCENEDTALGLSEELLDIGFGGYTAFVPEIPDDLPSDIAVKGGRKSAVKISAGVQGKVLVSKGSEGDIEARVILPSFVYAPVKKGDKVGELRYYQGSRLLRQTELRAAESADKKNIINVLSDVMKFVVEF